ncbi:MAG TPA: DUF418 domain-containing protein [Ferruginibacter sp.]|nr:DUF418 domain-containing protein [Ferruginibacter sp.]
MSSLEPVKNQEREIFMDVLRGFCILGIFIANLNAFTWYDFVDPHTKGKFLIPGWDEKMQFLHHILIEGKFYSIFSFLFGWGIALQLKRAKSKKMRSSPLIRRRLTIMLFLGAFHLLIWPGDIIFFYALMGFVLLFFRKFSNKALLVTGILFLLSPIVLYALKMLFPVLNYPSSFMYKIGANLDEKLIGVTSDETFKTYIRTANWWEILKGDLSGFFFRYGDLLFQSRIFKVLGMMLIGFVVGRSQFYKKIADNRSVFYYIIFFGLFVGIPANYVLATYMDNHDTSYAHFQIDGLSRTIAYAIGVAPLAATYIALFMLAYENRKNRRYLEFLAPVGKMAFTNYVLQTLIGNFVFLNAGLGFMEKVGPVYYTLFAIIVFIFQVIFSSVWLKNFNYGPLEWIWRSATYGQFQKFRK